MSYETRCLLWYLYYSNVCHLTDLQLRQQDVQHQEDTAAADDAFVDKETVAKLTEGLLSHYLPDLQKSKGTLHELTWVLRGAHATQLISTVSCQCN